LSPVDDKTPQANGTSAESKKDALPKDPVTLSWEETKQVVLLYFFKHTLHFS